VTLRVEPVASSAAITTTCTIQFSGSADRLGRCAVSDLERGGTEPGCPQRVSGGMSMSRTWHTYTQNRCGTSSLQSWVPLARSSAAEPSQPGRRRFRQPWDRFGPLISLVVGSEDLPADCVSAGSIPSVRSWMGMRPGPRIPCTFSAVSLWLARVEAHAGNGLPVNAPTNGLQIELGHNLTLLTTRKLELTRLRGHLNVRFGGVHDGREDGPVRTGV